MIWREVTEVLEEVVKGGSLVVTLDFFVKYGFATMFDDIEAYRFLGIGLDLLVTVY
jgi:hypothetical protein